MSLSDRAIGRHQVLILLLQAQFGALKSPSISIDRGETSQKACLVLAITKLLLNTIWATLPSRVVLILVAVVLIVHLIGIVLSLPLSLLVAANLLSIRDVESVKMKETHSQASSPLVSASLSTSPPTKPARSSLAKAWLTVLPSLR